MSVRTADAKGERCSEDYSLDRFEVNLKRKPLIVEFMLPRGNRIVKDRLRHTFDET